MNKCIRDNCEIQTKKILCKTHLKEYNKTWYRKIQLAKWSECPSNWITGRRINILGIGIVIWHCAKSNYKWSN